MTGRDISLAESTGGRIHMMHISTVGSIDLIRRAKARGVRITAEVSPQHFSLTDEALRSFDSNKKINPPLRGQLHVDACIAGLKDGTLDVIASDHQPQAVEKKMQEMIRCRKCERYEIDYNDINMNLRFKAKRVDLMKIHE